MLSRIRQFFAPPVFADDQDKERLANLLNAILWTNLGVWLVSLVVVPLSANFLSGVVAVGLMCLLAIVCLVVMRRGHVQPAGVLFSLMLWFMATALVFVTNGVSSPMASGYLVVVIVASLLVGRRVAMLFAALSFLAIVAAYGVEIVGYLPAPLIAVNALTSMSVLLGNLGAATILLLISQRNMTNALKQSRHYAAELETQRGHLEEMVVERTGALERRAGYLQATIRVSQSAVSVLNVQELLSQVVGLISQQFGFYHAGLFLLDSTGKWAELQAASSAGGQQMLARHHRIRTGTGIVGTVVERSQPRIASDVAGDAFFLNNPDLPQTRSEMALPLRARGKIIGVLDVQSQQPQAFSEEDVAVLQALADQVAMAISNARLFQQVEESADAERRAFGQLSQESWRDLLREQPHLGFLSDGYETAPAGNYWEPRMEAAVQTGEPAVEDRPAAALALPIKIREQIVGVVDACKPDGAAGWTPAEIDLLTALVQQVNEALESARLYRDAQQREMRERLIGQVTARMRETLDIRTVLETAADELYRTLGLDSVAIHLAQAADGDRGQPSGNGGHRGGGTTAGSETAAGAGDDVPNAPAPERGS